MKMKDKKGITHLIELEEIVYNFPTKYEEGFTLEEQKDLIKSKFNHINFEEFKKALGVNTCMVIDEQVITYSVDVYFALRSL